MGVSIRFLVALMAPAVVLLAQDAQAFDILGGALNAAGNLVSNVGGAAVHKVFDDSPEQLAAKRKQADEEAMAQYQKQLDKIDAMPDLTPLAKEHACLNLANVWKQSLAMRDMARSAEDAKRAANDQMLTAGGMLGAVGTAAAAGVTAAANDPLNMSNKALINQGHQMVQPVIPQMNSIAAQADAGKGNMQIASLGNVSGSAASGTQVLNAWQQLNLMPAAIPPFVVGTSDQNSQQPANAGLPYKEENGTPSPFLFTADLGKSIYIEFLGSAGLTDALRKMLRQNGYTVVDTPAQAQVQYQFQGDYDLNGGKLYESLHDDAGAVHDGKLVSAPQAKTGLGAAVTGSVANFFGSSLGSALVKGAPGELLSRKSSKTADGREIFAQQTVVVVNRQVGGVNSRAATFVDGESPDVMASAMVNQAISDLLVKTAALPPVPEPSIAQAAPVSPPPGR